MPTIGQGVFFQTLQSIPEPVPLSGVYIAGVCRLSMKAPVSLAVFEGQNWSPILS